MVTILKICKLIYLSNYHFVFRPFILVLICLFFNCSVFSQNKFFIKNSKGTDKIKFKFINNLIILPVEVNGVELSFLLDTGVSKPILFNFLNVSDSLKIKNAKSIYLRGLGEGNSIEALKSSNNILKIGDAIKLNQDLYAVYNANLNFSPKVGVTVHGIIGYDIFKDLIVEINYSKSFLRLTEPDFYKYDSCNKCEAFNLEFYNNKPYLNAKVTFGDKKISVKLLIDSGSSDALWLFENKELGIVSGNVSFDDFLGHGLSGSVYGKRSKIKGVSLKSFGFKNVNVAYPDSNSIFFAKRNKGRNGSLSGNILKRFNIVFDYRRALVTFKKNRNFKDKFSYNNSGLELEHSGVRFVRETDKVQYYSNTFGGNTESRNSTKIVLDTKYKMSLKPAYTIVELREGSPAEGAGLRLGDLVLYVNGKSVHQLSLQQLMAKFYEEDGKCVKVTVDRGGTILTYQFNLRDIFK